MPGLENHWFAERVTYLGRSLSKDTVRWRKASDTFPRVKSDPKAEGQHKLTGKAPFVRECRKALRNLVGSSDFSMSWKDLYGELMVGSTSDTFVDQLGWSMEEMRSHWNCALGLGFLINDYSLTWWLARNALLLLGLNYKASLVDTSRLYILTACIRVPYSFLF